MWYFIETVAWHQTGWHFKGKSANYKIKRNKEFKGFFFRHGSDHSVFVLINIYNVITELEGLTTLSDLSSILDNVKNIYNENIFVKGANYIILYLILIFKAFRETLVLRKKK